MSVANPLKVIKKKANAFLARRSHRSFRLSKRRDYARSLKIPGYIAFAKYVVNLLWQNRRIFILLAVTYGVLIVTMVGITSESTYNTLKQTIDTTSGSFFTGWGVLGKAGLLFVSTVANGFSTSLAQSQQLYAVLIILLTWLTIVWLLRNILAGHEVRLRDGLYNAGAPILSTIIIFIVFLIQLLPITLAVIFYSAALSTGMLAGGVEAMLFWIVAGLLAVLSLYWITSTFFALVIVTLPGMYPYRALKTAGDIVANRRFRILLRLLWLFVSTIIVWAVIMIPIIMFDSWIKSVWVAISWVPIVPVMILILSSLTIVWVSSYIYLFYRKVIADDAKPA
jgi:hypothetical protein